MKKIFLILIGIIATLLVIAAFLPKDFKIEQKITINKPVSEVYSYLKILDNNTKWNPWSKKDPNMKRDFRGADGEVGAISIWSGNSNVGSGEQEITNLVPNKRIDFELRFKTPMKTTNKGYYQLEEVTPTQTKVTWVMTGRTPYPINLICYFMKKQVNQEFVKGLNNVKEILEK